MNQSPRNILEKYWGFTSFRSSQEEIINSVLNGQDTVALLPTGGGKSICFQIPALVQEGICIVISPLVALMNDQVNNLKAKGIKAMALSGGMSFSELNIQLDNASYGNFKFLYLSPERLQQEFVQNVIERMPVSLIAVDEAHCISQWGNDFRPAYKNITVLRKLHPLVPIIALTATATPEVLKDTIEELRLELPAVFKESFVRSNLAYRVHEVEDKLYHTVQFLKNNTGTAIIYVRSRKTAVETSEQLSRSGLPSTFYHGGISKEERTTRLAQWKSGCYKTMVATNAFGMGIDQPDVRFVIHTQLPESLEHYFQEAGRAGRDGQFAHAVLLYNEYDKVLVKKQFVDALPTPDDLKKLYRNLCNYFQISYGEGAFTQHPFNFSDFCETYDRNSMTTYTALTTLDRLGIIQLSKEFGRTSTIQFSVSSKVLLNYFSTDPKISVIGKTMLRLYGGIFEVPTSVNLEYVAKKTGRNVTEIIEVLKKLKEDGVADVLLRITDATLTFIQPREDDRTINVVSKQVKTLNRKKESQVQAVLRYIENDSECKQQQLVGYFGESATDDCGICSVCIAKKKVPSTFDLKNVSQFILKVLEEKEMTSRELSERSTFEPSVILDTLRLLLEQGRIHRTSSKHYRLKN
jgi:ATP-dependent DNA helicase RecQ